MKHPNCLFEKYLQLTKFDLLTFVPQCFIKQIGFQLSFIPISVRTKLGLHGYGHLFQVALKKLQDCLKQFYQRYTMHRCTHWCTTLTRLRRILLVWWNFNRSQINLKRLHRESAAFQIKFPTHFLMKLIEASSPILLTQIEVVQFCLMWDGNSGW